MSHIDEWEALLPPHPAGPASGSLLSRTEAIVWEREEMREVLEKWLAANPAGCESLMEETREAIRTHREYWLEVLDAERAAGLIR